MFYVGNSQGNSVGINGTARNHRQHSPCKPMPLTHYFTLLRYQSQLVMWRVNACDLVNASRGAFLDRRCL